MCQYQATSTFHQMPCSFLLKKLRDDPLSDQIMFVAPIRDALKGLEETQPWIQDVVPIVELIFYNHHAWSCITSCFLIRRQLAIQKPILSFVTALATSLFAPMILGLLLSPTTPLSVPSSLILYFVPTWILFNYSPFDIIFHIFRGLSAILSMISGYWAGFSIRRVVQAAQLHWESPIIPIVLGIVAGAGRYVILNSVGQTFGQKTRSAGPVIFGATCAALAFNFILQPGDAWYQFDIPEAADLGVWAFALVAFLHWCIPDKAFTAVWNAIGAVAGFLIPYYGSTWERQSRPNVVPAQQRVKAKTD